MNFDMFERASKALQELEPKRKVVEECEHIDYIVNPDCSKVCTSCCCVIGYYDDTHDIVRNTKYCYKKSSEFTKIFRVFTSEFTVNAEVLANVIKQYNVLVEQIRKRRSRRKSKKQKNTKPKSENFVKEFKKICLSNNVRHNDVCHYYNAYKNYPMNLKISDLERIKHYAMPFLHSVQCNVLYRAVIYFVAKDKFGIEPMYLISMCSEAVVKKWDKLYRNYITSSFSNADILLDSAN